ncbi:MAG TPA: TRAP transporter large permease [Atribacterota bacterium]|nr:TRAP transporter large permease [Atribacterota bacterium]
MVPGILVVSIFFILVFLSVPIAYALAVASAIIMVTFGDVDLWNLVARSFSGMNSFPLQAIPFFMFTGLMMNASGITESLIRLSDALVGRFRGGLAHVNIVVSMLFAGNSGSSQADVSGIGSILMPAMLKKGYSKNFTLAVTAASSTMAVIIPPSLMMVVYASILSVSVGAMFIGGIIPGVLLALGQMGIVYVYALKNDYPRERKYKFKETLSAIKGGIAPALIPVIVIFGLLSGYFTATEAGLITSVYSIIFGCFIYRTVNLKKLISVFKLTGITTGLILFCIGTSMVFSYIIAYYQLPNFIMKVINSMNFTPQTYLLLVTGVFLIVGTFMDATPAMLIFLPMLGPAADLLGINPIQFGLVSIVTLAIGLVTPPFGLCLLIGAKIIKHAPEKALKTLSIFIMVELVIVVLIIYFPQIVLWLPSIFIK